jgi:tetratricopeptide (TPR) repeat protein
MKKVLIFTAFVLTIFISAVVNAEEPLSFKMHEGSQSGLSNHNNEGISHYKAGRFDEALKHFEAALNINPKCGEANFNKALTLDKLGRHKEAAEFFTHAMHHAQGNEKISHSKILGAHIDSGHPH